MIALPHALALLAPRAAAALNSWAPDAWGVRGRTPGGEWIKRPGA